MDTVQVSNNDTNINSNTNSNSQKTSIVNNGTNGTMKPTLNPLKPSSDRASTTNIAASNVSNVSNVSKPQQQQPPLPLITNIQQVSASTNHMNHNEISPLPHHHNSNAAVARQFSSTKTPQYPSTTNNAHPPPPSLSKNTSTNNMNPSNALNHNHNNHTPNIQRNNQNLFQSLYTPNVTGINHHNIANMSATPIISSANHSHSPAPLQHHAFHKTPIANRGYHSQDTKLHLRRGRPKKSSHSHRKAFEAGHPRFERALQQLIEMRQKHPQGLLPSIRGFMQTIHMGFANTNAVVKYYSNNYLNMTLDDFKRDYMVIRRVRAKSRSNSGGRPKKTSTVSTKIKYDDKTSSSASDSEDNVSNRHHRSSHYNRKRNKAPLQPLKSAHDNNHRSFAGYNHHQTPLSQQLLMNQLAANPPNHNNTRAHNNIDFNFPLFFEGIANNDSSLSMRSMPKLIADTKHDIDRRESAGVKMEQDLKSRMTNTDFEANTFISQLENDLAVLMELQDTSNGGVTSVSPEDIKKPLSVVRKRLLTMLDRSLYHQLNHAQKVTIAKANLIAGICTAAIHTGYCKDALALYRQSLTLFRELNSDAVTKGYPVADRESKTDEIDPFILNLIQNCNSNEQDPGKYSMFIVVIYYQMSLLYDKSLIEKVQKSRYYLIQALNLLVRENAMNSNKYCIETLQRLALFALETGKDSEYISMMLITLRILRKCNENSAKILDVEIHFAKNLLSYGHQLPNTNAPQQRERFESVKTEYQKLLTQIIVDAKQDNASINTETRRTLSKLLELARFLLDYNQLNESYKVYHCMRKMCDDTQINLDLDFMKIWIDFVKGFIAQIVKHNANNNVMRNGNNSNTQMVLWSEQLLELCEFDVKVLEKIQQTTEIQIGTDIFNEYILCAKALIAVNINYDSQIIMRCKSYVEKAKLSQNEQVKKEAQALLDSLSLQTPKVNK